MNLASLSAVEASQLLGVSEKTVRNWMNKSGLPFSDAGRSRVLDWPSTFRWYLETQVTSSGKGGNQAVKSDPVSPPDDSETYEEALTRKTKAEANLKELQLAQRRGQVASIADVEKVLNASVKATQTQVLAVPSRLATRILGLEDHARAVSILDAEMRQLLTNLATIDAVREASDLAAQEEEE